MATGGMCIATLDLRSHSVGVGGPVASQAIVASSSVMSGRLGFSKYESPSPMAGVDLWLSAARGHLQACINSRTPTWTVLSVAKHEAAARLFPT